MTKARQLPAARRRCGLTSQRHRHALFPHGRRQAAPFIAPPHPRKTTKKQKQKRTVSPAANRAASSTYERTNSSAVRACVREASWARGLHAQLVLILPWEAHRTTTSSARVGTIRDMFPATEPILLHRSKPGGEGRDFFSFFFEREGGCTDSRANARPHHIAQTRENEQRETGRLGRDACFYPSK